MAYEPKSHIGGRVEDFTTPFLVTAGALCFVILFTIWALYGVAIAVGLSWAVNRFVLTPRA